jgi:hypothetical protein
LLALLRRLLLALPRRLVLALLRRLVLALLRRLVLALLRRLVQGNKPTVDLDVLLLGDALLDEERADVLPLVALSQPR